jgi:phosphatidylinositol-3-phosphatase
VVLSVAVAALVLPALLCSLASKAASVPLSAPAGGAPPVGHVWLIMLENHSWAENFGPPAQGFQPRAGSPESMTYLAKTLPSLGARLDDYYGIAHPSDSNYTAWVSGQPPSFGFFSHNACPKTGFPKLGVTFCTGSLLDCLYYTPFVQTGSTEDGVAIGQGCVYPKNVPDVGTQLRDATPALTVKAYQEDMDRPCQHVPLGGYDEGDAGGTPGYETGGNPFMYFANWIDEPASCEAADVPLNRNTFEPLVKDLRSVATTPNLSWIGPNLCDQGHDYCPNFYANRANEKFFEGAEICHGEQPASEYCDAQTSAFLNMLIPKITASPAYKENGLIVITWDEANFYNSSPYVDNRACCNEPNEPGATGEAGVVGQVRIPGIATINVTPGTNRLLLGGPDTAENIFGALKLLFEHPGEALSWQPGGGDSGALMLSPFIKPGTVSTAPYNHYSVLRTLQNVFGLPHTGNAADQLVGTIGSEVFNDVPRAQSLSLLASARPGGGLLTLDRSRGTTLRLVGDGVVVHARCRAAGRRTCRGVATLSLSGGGKHSLSLLGRRSYVQLSDRPRDLTIYLSRAACRYLHAHRRVGVRLTLASHTRRGKTASARRALTLLTTPR